ncbi:hypothetical protein DAPPUDRAFT_107784 [Daphnia pulex]|uniref:Uncharacterized protein n=1 Tax=Daphnia pulex TaxID=6669 RepID=E9GY82_DAPPU|nr:hypothetical protein DAPPUDRAFT_107784 [Daphnia pulex]|eukprot:EFX75556.1 hypothetical protein DAPPUDRAFT_107784 [Daphnia pulex]
MADRIFAPFAIWIFAIHRWRGSVEQFFGFLRSFVFKSELWSHVGVVVAIRRYDAYHMKFASGSVLWRDQRFLRRLVNTDDGEDDHDGIPDQALDNGGDGNNGASHATEESGDDEMAVRIDKKSAAPRANPHALRRSLSRPIWAIFFYGLTAWGELLCYRNLLTVSARCRMARKRWDFEAASCSELDQLFKDRWIAINYWEIVALRLESVTGDELEARSWTLRPTPFNSRFNWDGDHEETSYILTSSATATTRFITTKQRWADRSSCRS